MSIEGLDPRTESIFGFDRPDALPIPVRYAIELEDQMYSTPATEEIQPVEVPQSDVMYGQQLRQIAIRNALLLGAEVSKGSLDETRLAEVESATARLIAQACSEALALANDAVVWVAGEFIQPIPDQPDTHPRPLRFTQQLTQ